MERQNVTLSLPKALLKKAKAFAAKKDKSLSMLLKESLEDKIGEATGYNKARERQLGVLQRGLDLGTKGRISISREELHAR
ncbi:MAG: DUF6364 family protein [Nitrospirae bacterium]|nr:DUF6364 family protein [Nitrospirota bacterium]